jgi:hypothetical protein
MYQIQKSLYFCGNLKAMATATTKKINWLFPDPDVEVTLEEYRDKIREDERSGDMSVSEFKRRLETWLAESNK